MSRCTLKQLSGLYRLTGAWFAEQAQDSIGAAAYYRQEAQTCQEIAALLARLSSVGDVSSPHVTALVHDLAQQLNQRYQ
jgi:hypothetical protein